MIVSMFTAADQDGHEQDCSGHVAIYFAASDRRSIMSEILCAMIGSSSLTSDLPGGHHAA